PPVPARRSAAAARDTFQGSQVMPQRFAAATLAVCVSLAVDAFAQTKPTSTQPARGAAAQPAAQAPSTPATTGTSGTQPLTSVGQPVPVDRGSPAASRDPKSTSYDMRPPANIPDPRGLDMSAFQIGPEDLLDISVWKNVELSRVVPVRPDGKVSLPLVNDIQAAG